jgi:hypothetical protein
MNQIEREEEHLEQQLARGEISLAEYNKELRELHRDFRASIQEQAEQAYQDVMDRLWIGISRHGGRVRGPRLNLIDLPEPKP